MRFKNKSAPASGAPYLKERRVIGGLLFHIFRCGIPPRSCKKNLWPGLFELSRFLAIKTGRHYL
jgi:hypothetical protein